MESVFRIAKLKTNEKNFEPDGVRPSSTEWAEIIWVKSGHGYITIEGQPYPIKNDTIYWIRPKQCFTRNLQADGYYLSFHLKDIHLSEVFKPGRLVRDRVISLESNQICAEHQFEMEEILIRIMNEFSKKTVLQMDMLTGYLNLFMIYFSRHFGKCHQDRPIRKDDEMVIRFLAMSEKYFINKKSVSEYARELFVTPNYLNRTVKKLTGFPASHHIHQQIMEEAKRQAFTSETNMKQIAGYLGFGSIAHFSKFFKSKSGINFSDYRKAISYSGYFQHKRFT